MLDQTTRQRSPVSVALPPTAAPSLRARLFGLGTVVIQWMLGAADGHTVATMARRELSLILRSGEWHRLMLRWAAFCGALLIIPILYRTELGQWRSPSGEEWYLLCGYALQAGVFGFMVSWSVGRLRRDMSSSRLDELLLTRCSAADIAMGEALATAVASLWLVAAAFPTCLFLSALAGREIDTSLRLALSLAPAAGLGVWFGMGWGMAFAIRRPGTMMAPLTDWWVKTPFVPVYVLWGAVLALPVIWAMLALIPGGTQLVFMVVGLVLWSIRWVVAHCNPLLTVSGTANLGNTTWLLDWLVLVGLLLFMMRKSMDAVYTAMNSLPERDIVRREVDHWVHHDGHYFTQYGSRRREPAYYDGGNPITAFDVALGHRVYLHPFIWAVAIMAYLCFLVWSLMVPSLGEVTGLLAVLTPATGALLLMSGGVAVSFGWERDQHRWPALAVLPLSNHRLAWGKIKGVVRPTLWVALVASLTSVLLGLRGTWHMEASLWMALHVLVFPVSLAFVSATLTLTTPSLAEALYRWAILGAIPTLATALPPPIGGEAGLAMPATPPLLALLIVVEGPTHALVRASFIALGLEILGVVLSIAVMHWFLRRITVGERD